MSITVGEVDRVQVEPELAGDHLGRHRLAGARVAGEQRRDAAAAPAARAHPPLVEHLVAVPGAQRDLAQLGRHGRGQHEVVPADGRLDPAGQPFEPGGVLRPRAVAQVVAVTGVPRTVACSAAERTAAGRPGRG